MNFDHERHEVDAWDAHRLELKRKYMAEGMGEEAADDKATNDVRREIRDGPVLHRGTVKGLLYGRR
jgi:hypothetical protein